ncbi:hypothetical protein SAMN05877809_105153, partial [Rhodobacter sp. JA431]|uniref:beta strand repeat-containing protein n=1 Tax=Rhodobacter sp. JA431 TaxID=570013 RepID=UPI000BDC3CAA
TFNTGNVTVGSDGTLTVGDADALTLENMNVGGGSGTTDVSAGGTLDVREGATLASAVTSASAVTNAGTINGTLGLSGAGSLLQSTSGVVTGTATLASGTQITSDGSLADVLNRGSCVNQSTGQAGTVTNQGLGSVSNAGTLGALIHNSSNSFANTGDITGAVSVSNGTVTNTGTMDAGASVTGGTLTNSGQVAGDVSVTGGDFNLSGGTVVDGSGAGAGPGDVTIGDDTGAAGFLATGTSSIAGAFSVGAQGTAIVGNTDATPDQLTVSGTTDVTGAGGNAAALSVVGGATFNTGNVTVGSDGTLTVGDADALTLENMNVGGGSGTTDVSAGGTLDVREGATLASAVTSASAVTNAGTINGTLGLSGAGSLLQSTSGVVTGTATLASGTQITSDGSLADVLNSGTFVNQSNGQAGTVTNQGLGTGSNAGTLGALIHNSSNSFANTGDITGAVSVSNGTVTNTGTMDAGASVTGGTLTNSGQVAGDVSVTGGDFNLSGGTVVDGSGAGAGPGDVTIGDDTGAAGFLATGTSSIAGAFSVGAQGTAIVGNTDATPDQLTVSGTTDVTGAGGNAAALSVVGGATFNTGNVTVGSDGTLTVGDADALTLENMNVGGGSGTMDVSAGGTLDVREGATLASAVTSAGTVTNAGAITGSVGVSAGTVTNAATGAMNGGALVSGGALDNAGQIAGDVSVTGGSFTLSDGSSVTVGAASGDVTIDGVGTQFDTTGTSSIAGDFALLNGGQATIGDGVIATVLTVSGAGGTTVDGTSSLTVTSNATLLSAISNTGTINFENSALVTGSITGAGLLNVSGDATVDGSISSANTISLANGTTGQTFSVTGDLVGVSNTVLAFDVDLADGAADIDLIDVTGEVSGSFLLSFADATSANADLPASDLTFLLWGSENAASFTYDFTDLTQNNPSYDYTVVPESGGSGLALHVAIDQDVGALAGSVALSQSLIGALVNRPTSPFTVGRAIPEEKNCAPGGWGRVTGGNVDASGDTTDSGGMQNGSNVTATYTGVQLGGDLSCFNGSIGGWDMAFGGFLGFNRGSGTISTISVANSTATSSPTANDFQQSYGGVYMTASKGNLVADLQVRTEKTDFTLNNASIAGTALSDATFASRATTVSGSVSASFPLKETGWNLVPTAGFMLSRSKTDTITFDLRSGETQPATLQIDDHTTKLGFLGLSASKLRIAETGDSAKSYFITGTYYRDFSEDLASHYADPENAIQGSLASETLGSFGEISIGMSYLKVLQTNGHGLPAKQFNASVRLDGRFSGSMNSTALTAQARWQF